MKRENRRMVLRKLSWLAFVYVLALAPLAGCNNANKQPPKPRTEFERDLISVKNGGFAHIYVFARKDGQSMQADDKSFLKAHAPDDVNSTWYLTDSERRVIVGTNVDFTPEHMNALVKRFAVDDYTGK
jgi:hypothetical protein